jgi:gliding motility-associated-like protein
LKTVTNKDEIAELFRNKLSEHQEPVDPSIWTGIQGNLHAPVAGPAAKAVSIAKSSGIIKTLVVSGLIIGGGTIGTFIYLNSTENEDVSQNIGVETIVSQPSIPEAISLEGAESTQTSETKDSKNQSDGLSGTTQPVIQQESLPSNSGTSKEPITDPLSRIETSQSSNLNATIQSGSQPSKINLEEPAVEQTKDLTGVKSDITTETKNTEDINNQYLTKNIPNIFTPNGDGLNDYFEIPLAYGLTHQTKIFDKSGVLVAEFDERLEGWNGTDRSNTNVSNGTYFYVTFVSDGKSAPKQYKGSIILKR